MDITLLEAQSFWPHLSDAQKALVRERARTAHFSAGEAIKMGNQSCIGPLFVVSGIVRDVLILPTPVFSQLMEENLYVENFVYRSSTERLSDLIQAVERMFFMTLRQRVAAFLIDESASSGNSTLSLTQEHLARAIGSAREAVSRILKQLSQAGSIEVSRGGIRILDKAKLYQELSEDDTF